MAEGAGGPEFTRPQEGLIKSPIEASKGFLGKMVHGVGEAAITAGYAITPGAGLGLVAREINRQHAEERAKAGLPKKLEAEAKPETPTEASNNFMNNWRERLRLPRRIINVATGFPMGLITAGASAGIVKELGINPIPDIVEGRWGILAAKGALASLAVVSTARFTKRGFEALTKSTNPNNK